MASIASKIKSIKSVAGKVKTAVGQVKTAVSQQGFNPVLGGGNIAAAEKGFGATGNPATNLYTSKGTINPVYTKGGTSSNATNKNISPDGTALMNTRSFSGSSTSSFSSPTGSTNNVSVQNSPLGNAVTATSIKPAVDVNLAGTNPDDYLKDYSYDIPGAVQPQEETELQKTQKEQDDVLQRMLKSINDVPSSADAYNKAQKQSGIEQARQQVNDLSGQLNAIVAKGQANQLSLVGQGRGIPEAIIGGQQAQIGRETAIAALPVQAQLEAAQGNLEMANDSLDRLFKIYSDDATNRYNAKNKSLEAISGHLDKKEQRLWDEQKILNDRAYQERQAVIKDGKDKANMAFSFGQSSLGAKIMALNPNSPNYQQDLAELSSKLKDPVQTAQLRKLNAEIANLQPSTTSGANEDLMAYASRYSESGTLPNPSELKLSGLSVGQVTLFAKQIPKNKGAVVSIQTGTKPTNVSAEAEKDFQKLYNVVEMTKRLKELDENRIGGVVAGALGKLTGSEAQSEYLTLRKAIVDEMSRMQSGAALTEEEVATYNDYLPGRFSESFFLGQDSYKKISNFETAMNQKLQNRLSNNGLSIYGYSKVQIPGDLPNVIRTVGEIIDVGGVNYRVLPDGSLTDIL